MQSKISVSILLPSIRSRNLIKFYDAAKKAAEVTSFEIIVVSPYKIPDELLKNPRIVYLRSYANPNICLAQAASLASGEYLYNCTDDGLLQENAIDIANDIFNQKLNHKDAINMVYIEDVLNAADLTHKKEPIPFHPNYWSTFSNPDFQKKAISPSWRIAPHFFMKRAYFEDLGGIDCQYEYNNFSLHDLIFRLQHDGGNVYDLPITAFLCSHLENETGDHFAIHRCQTLRDKPKFDELYSKEDAVSSRVKLDINDWKNHDKVWKERFPDTNNLPIEKI